MRKIAQYAAAFYFSNKPKIQELMHGLGTLIVSFVTGLRAVFA